MSRRVGFNARPVGYLAGVVEAPAKGRRSLYPGPAAREVAVFVAVVALFVDVVFYVALAEAQLGGGQLAAWSAGKIVVIGAVVGWLAVETRTWSLGIIALIFLLIGLEDSIGVTAPLGVWLIEESGIRRGPQGANSQLLRRGIVMISLIGPTLYLAAQAPRWLRAAVWTLLGFLAAIFLAAVAGDLAADRTGTNLDELIEEPLLSLCVGFVAGLAVEWWPFSRLRGPTRRPPQRGFPRS